MIYHKLDYNSMNIMIILYYIILYYIIYVYDILWLHMVSKYVQPDDCPFGVSLRSWQGSPGIYQPSLS